MSVISGRCENEAVNDTLPPMRLQPQIIRCCVTVFSLHHRIDIIVSYTIVSMPCFVLHMRTVCSMRTSAPRPFHMCRRPTQSPIAAFCRHQSPGSAYQQTVDYWWPSFRSPAHRHGMTSRKTWHQQNHWPHFVTYSRYSCSGSLFLTTCWTST